MNEKLNPDNFEPAPERDKILIKAGTIVHLEGVPFELVENTPVYGNKDNLTLLSKTKDGRAAVTIPPPQP